jgi:hypothetical protein
MTTNWIQVAFRDYGSSRGFIRSTAIDAIMVQQVVNTAVATDPLVPPPDPTYEVRVFSRGQVFNVTNQNNWNWPTAAAAMNVAQGVRDAIIAAEATP